jgi:probable F420-dependent oxidoreductase
MSARRDPLPEFRFAVVADAPADARTWLDIVSSAEALGYHDLLITDHLTGGLSAIPALTAAAGATAQVGARIGLGSYVLNGDLRNAAVMVAEFRALQQLGATHLTLGVGAGWLPGDYVVAGVPLDSGEVRFARFARSVRLIRESISAGLEGVELLVAGARQRVLTLAGATADVVSIVPRLAVPLGAGGPMDHRDMLPDKVDEQVGWVHRGAADRGDPPILNHLVWGVAITTDVEPVRDRIAQAWGCSVDDAAELLPYLTGTVDEVARTLVARRARWGFSYVVVPAAVAVVFAPVLTMLRRGPGHSTPAPPPVRQ